MQHFRIGLDLFCPIFFYGCGYNISLDSLRATFFLSPYTLNSLYDLANVVPTLAKFYHQASEAYEQACTRHISMIIYYVSNPPWWPIIFCTHLFVEH